MPTSRFDPGDRVLLWTPGGGGYGDPGKRDPARIQEDLAEGYVTPEAAHRLYRGSELKAAE